MAGKLPKEIYHETLLNGKIGARTNGGRPPWVVVPVGSGPQRGFKGREKRRPNPRGERVNFRTREK